MEQYKKMYLYKRIVQAKLFMDNYYAENIDLVHTSDEACFSKYHFIRLFKAAYGKTPHHYLACVRIEHARLLLTADKSILEVSILVGFDSPTSFTAAFKKIVGMTPSDFQTRHRLRTEKITANPLVAIPNCFAQSHGFMEEMVSHGPGGVVASTEK